MIAAHGFQETMTAMPGMGDELVAFFLHAAAGAGPGAAEGCVLFLVDRWERDPDTVFVTEGRTSKEAHERFFASNEANAVHGGVKPWALTLHHHSPRLHVVAGHRGRRMTVDRSRPPRASRSPQVGAHIRPKADDDLVRLQLREVRPSQARRERFDVR
jgi:hypothetical protein